MKAVLSFFIRPERIESVSRGEKMLIGVIGAGALGLYYGAMLQRGGNRVKFLLRRDFQAISQKGLSVKSINGDFQLPNVDGFPDPAGIGPVDLVLVGLKSIANDRMAELVAPLIGSETAILTLQNGLGNEEILAEAFGADRVLGGVAFLCSNRGEPGTVHHLGQGRVTLGEYRGGLSTRAERVASIFTAAGIPCRAVTDLAKARWEKLVWNIPFNGLSALTGCDVTQLLAHPPTRTLAAELMSEVIAAANVQGLSSPIDPETFIPAMVEATDGMDHYQPSMMIDRREGRPLELEAIYGIPIIRGQKKGIAMPRVEMLHALLELGES